MATLAAAALVGTVGTAATAGVAATAATAGLIGTAGAVTAGGLLTAAGAGLSALSAISSLQKGKAEAAVAAQQGETIRLQGEQDAIDKRKQLLETVASVNAQAAASGISLTGQGSVENARIQAKAEATRQLGLIRHNTAVGVADKRVESAQAKTAGRARAVGLLADAGDRLSRRG